MIPPLATRKVFRLNTLLAFLSILSATAQLTLLSASTVSLRRSTAITAATPTTPTGGAAVNDLRELFGKKRPWMRRSNFSSLFLDGSNCSYWFLAQMELLQATRAMSNILVVKLSWSLDETPTLCHRHLIPNYENSNQSRPPKPPPSPSRILHFQLQISADKQTVFWEPHDSENLRLCRLTIGSFRYYVLEFVTFFTVPWTCFYLPSVYPLFPNPVHSKIAHQFYDPKLRAPE